MTGLFIWCDLSAYHPAQAEGFYEDLFGWRFDASEGGYLNAFAGNSAVAGVYEMPAKFRDIGLPSFWMSYIAVESVATVVAAAKAQGGRIEMQERDGSEGSVALIRDPLGAGFTVYEGDGERGGMGMDAAGLRVGHALYISDASAVKPFYRALFGWQFEPRDGYYDILSAEGAPVASIHECDAEERGGFEYWGIGFAVEDMPDARRRVLNAGGTVFGEMRLGQHVAVSVADRDDAAFLLIERKG